MSRPALWFTTEFDQIMVPDGKMEFQTLSLEEAAGILRPRLFVNVTPPAHIRILQVLSRAMQVDLTQLQGGNVCLLQVSDQCILAHLPGLRNSAQEYTDDQEILQSVVFRLVTYEAESRRVGSYAYRLPRGVADLIVGDPESRARRQPR